MIVVLDSVIVRKFDMFCDVMFSLCVFFWLSVKCIECLVGLF